MVSFATPRKTAATATSSGALLAGRHTPVNASGGTRAMTLPTGANEGAVISVEKVDSSTNAVTVSGHIRGSSGQTITLSTQYAKVSFTADSSGSWWPLSQSNATGVASTDIADSTATGRSVITAANAAAARTALGAGTSNLAVGTGATDAMAGNKTAADLGGVPSSRTVAGKALSSNVTIAADDLSDVDMAGAVSGQVLQIQSDGTIKPGTISPSSPPPTNLDDVDDVAAASPTDGGLLVFSGDAGGWVGNFPLVGNLILAAGADVPAGTPPCMIWDLPVSLIKTHNIEGTNGSTVAYATENFSAFNGTAVTYTNAQALVGSTSFRVASGNTGYFSDTGLALSTLVVKGRFRTDGTPTGNVNIAEMRSSAASIGAIQRTSAGNLVLKDGPGVTRATSSTTIAADTWYQYEWKVSGATQTLRIFNAAGTQLEEISGSATSGTIDTFRYGIIANLNGAFYFDKCVLAPDWVGSAG